MQLMEYEIKYLRQVGLDFTMADALERPTTMCSLYGSSPHTRELLHEPVLRADEPDELEILICFL